MDSPKIASDLIPPLYQLARRRKVHMTTLVNDALAAHLARQPDVDAFPPDQSRPRASGCGGSGSGRASADEPRVPAAGPVTVAPGV